MTIFLMYLILILLYALGIWAVADFCFSMRSIIKCGCGKYAYYVPTFSVAHKAILNLVRDILKNAKNPLKIVDLGSGTGRLLFPLAKEFPEHSFVGYEWDQVLLNIAKRRAGKLLNITYENKNYMMENLSQFDIILCFIIKKQSEQLGTKLNQEIKDTAVVIAEKFKLKHLKEVKCIKSRTLLIPVKIFVYYKNKDKTNV